MIRVITLLLFSCFQVPALSAQHHLMIAGNTADAEPAFYASLGRRLEAVAGPKTVLFVGDYVAECTDAMQAYEAQNGNGAAVFPTVAPLVDLVRQHPGVTFYLIPGDRDWDNSNDNGLKCVKKLEDYLADQRLDNLKWPLKNGCPGPEFVDLSNQVSLLMVSTQWWNHPFDKPVPADADCPVADSEIVIDEVLTLLRENTDRNVVLAGHYPPVSQGRRGGSFRTIDYFSPPVIGGLIQSWKQNVGTPEEINNRRMAPLRQAYKNNNGNYEGLFFVGAQDRSQQLLAFRKNHVINAGAAGPGRWVAGHKPAVHVSRDAGFTEVVFADDGTVTYFYRTTDPTLPAFQRQLYHAPCDRALSDVPVNPTTSPCGVSDEEIAEMCASSPGETVRVTPGPEYVRGPVGEALLGKHYRESWNTPATVPVYTAGELKGGLTPLRSGGGLQTTSLRFRAPDGAEFVFRSVDKNPRKSLDFELRPTIVGSVVDDQTTIGHPFGPVVVPPLMDSLGILHVDSELLLLGNCPELGDFNPIFGGKLGTLEEVPRGRKKKRDFAGTFGAKSIHKSFEAFSRRFDDQEVRFAHNEFLRARLFDLLIGDWNRHEDNWKWAEFEEEGIKYLRPIPRDRDNAFSLIDGAGPWFASKVFLTRLEHFGFDKPDAGSLSYQSRHIDRLVLSPLVRADYQREAQAIQDALTDEIIERSVRRMPPETFAVSGEEIVAKLKARRDALLEFADDLYARYAETIDIVGTNDEEEFVVTTFPDDRVTVTVTDLKGRSQGQVLYERTFSPEETREVRLYGLSDDDQFVLRGEPVGKINVRLIGGPGKDEFRSEISGKGRKAAVYERSDVADTKPPPGMRYVNSYRDYLYHYDRTAHEFNKIRPAFGASFSGFNGLSLGVGLRYVRYNYKHRDYAAKYKLYFESNTQGNFLVELTADVNDVWRGVDLIGSTHYGVPDFYNFFFGIGNNSVFNEEAVERNEYHLVRLRNTSGEAGIRREFAGRSFFSIVGGLQHNRTEDTEGTVLDTDDFFGEGTLDYAFVRPQFVLDLRDDRKLPTKGVMLEAEHKQAFDVEGSGKFGVTRIGGESHISTRRIPLTLSVRVGYARSSGQVPFYELPAIGRNNGLRGFQRRRFAGDGYFFYNTEFRAPVTKIRSKFIPLTLGLRLFYDRGKLLMDGEEDEPMKDSYGVGLYVVPISSNYTLSATAGFSEEEAPIIRISGGVEF